MYNKLKYVQYTTICTQQTTNTKTHCFKFYKSSRLTLPLKLGTCSSHLISAHEQQAVSDVTKSPYMVMDCQFISIYGKFVTSQTASFSQGNINYPVSTSYYNTISSLFQVCSCCQCILYAIGWSLYKLLLGVYSTWLWSTLSRSLHVHKLHTS